MLVSDAIAYTLRLAGITSVGQVALPQDTADAQAALFMMMGQWQRKRWLVFRLDQLSVAVKPSKATYTIGPGVPADVPYTIRPGSIESAFLRQLTGHNVDSFPVDYPLRRIRSREEWNAIPLKNLHSWPGQWFYDPTLPNGTLYLWPIPIQTFFELHFAVAPDLAIAETDLELQDYLPIETEEALVYNLAGRLRVNYQLPPNQDLNALARSSLETLRTNNWAMRPLQMPTALRGSARLRNPMGGFFPETAAGIPFPVLQ